MKYRYFLFLLALTLLHPSVHSTISSKPPLLTDYVQAEVEVLSWSPRIFIFRHFLTDAECDYLIDLAKPFLTPSMVVDNSKANGNLIDKRRSSEGMAFPKYHNDPIIAEIEKRISLLTLIPIEHGENIQILHYHQGGEYQPHYDYFDANTPGGASYLENGGQRVASFLMYLNTPAAGGATIFPTAEIKVQPIKGDALLFFDCQLDGEVDSLTFHGGAPVLRGEKWLATRWLRQFPFE